MEKLVGHLNHLGVEPLNSYRQRRKQPHLVDALLVHYAEPGVPVLVVLGQRLNLATPALTVIVVEVLPFTPLGELP